MIDYSVGFDGPLAIRFPKGKASEAFMEELAPIEYGKSEVLVKGKDIAILSLGTMIHNAKKAIERLSEKGLDVALYDFKFLKPLDKDLANEALSNYKYILTVEDGCKDGGFGSAIAEYACENGFSNSIKRIGIPDNFVEHGSVSQLQKLCGMDAESIAEEAIKMIEK